jgi:hypothetical protein
MEGNMVSARVIHGLGMAALIGAYLAACSDGGVGPVHSVDAPPVLTFTSISADNNHTCGVTVGDDAYGWGRNSSGKLGDGSGADRLGAGPVSGGLAFASMSPGGNHTCGVTSEDAPL